MREFSLFFNGDALGWEELVPVDGLVNADGAQAIEAIQFDEFDVRGEDVHGLVTVGDRDEKVKHISFGCLSSPLPLLIPPVGVFGPVFVGFFHASHIHFVLCQIFALLFESFELLLIVMADFLIFVRNSSQSLCDEEEFLSPRVSMSFESGVYRSRGEL